MASLGGSGFFLSAGFKIQLHLGVIRTRKTRFRCPICPETASARANREMLISTQNTKNEHDTNNPEKQPRAAVCGVLGCVITHHAWATRSWVSARHTGTQFTVPHEERGNQIAHGLRPHTGLARYFYFPRALNTGPYAHPRSHPGPMPITLVFCAQGA